MSALVAACLSALGCWSAWVYSAARLPLSALAAACKLVAASAEVSV